MLLLSRAAGWRLSLARRRVGGAVLVLRRSRFPRTMTERRYKDICALMWYAPSGRNSVLPLGRGLRGSAPATPLPCAQEKRAGFSRRNYFAPVPFVLRFAPQSVNGRCARCTRLHFAHCQAGSGARLFALLRCTLRAVRPPPLWPCAPGRFSGRKILIKRFTKKKNSPGQFVAGLFFFTPTTHYYARRFRAQKSGPYRTFGHEICFASFHSPQLPIGERRNDNEQRRCSICNTFPLTSLAPLFYYPLGVIVDGGPRLHSDTKPGAALQWLSLIKHSPDRILILLQCIPCQSTKCVGVSLYPFFQRFPLGT